MTLDYIHTLFEYNYWEHRHVWDDCVMHLSDTQFYQDTGYSHGSIHAELVHVMSGEWWWLARAQGYSHPRSLHTADYPDRDSIRAKWDSIEADVRAFITSLNADGLDRAVRYTTPDGRVVDNHVWKILFHIINHGTIHRAEIMTISHRIGGPSFDLSLMQWLLGGRT